MSNFELVELTHYRTRQRVFKLLVNGKSLYDEFIMDVKSNSNFEPELGDLIAILKYVANGNTPFLRQNKYRKLKIKKLVYPAYEAKSKHLRLYVFTEKETGMVIVFGGSKSTQEETDLKNLEAIIKEYTASKM